MAERYGTAVIYGAYPTVRPRSGRAVSRASPRGGHLGYASSARPWLNEVMPEAMTYVRPTAGYVAGKLRLPARLCHGEKTTLQHLVVGAIVEKGVAYRLIADPLCDRLHPLIGLKERLIWLARCGPGRRERFHSSTAGVPAQQCPSAPCW